MDSKLIRNIGFLTAFAFFFLLTACNDAGTKKNKTNLSVFSPDNKLELRFFQDKNDRPGYSLTFGDELIIDSSYFSFEFQNSPELRNYMAVKNSNKRTFNETWEMPWGEKRFVKNNYNELTINLIETKMDPARELTLIFRLYNDGLGIRYEFPEWPDIDTLVVLTEQTEFDLERDHQVWWIPGDWDIYEHLYNTTRITEIDATKKRNHPNLAQTHIPYNAVNTPVTMRTDRGTHISFHEAALTNYPGMTLKVDRGSLTFTSELVGSDRLKYKARVALPFQSPWRTIQVSEDAAGLIESDLIVNLNEPNKLGNTDWFTPMKYVGIWWELHLGLTTWNNTPVKHGATTENAKKYIDFAAANNITGLLVEGWNTGWENWNATTYREGIFDFVTPYPDYDINEVVSYAREKGVELIMHHETVAAPRTYEQQLDTAYALMEKLGIHAVKTGYVGTIIPEGEYHHGQWMVNHYRNVLERAAESKIAVNAHEPIKATGIRRTYPNAISREGLRGQEFNAWSSEGGNPPEHLPIVAFTRMLAGPIDYTPGAFEMTLPTKPDNEIKSTLANQLALYVVLFSPVQMACDLPSNYEGQPAFQFIRDVGVDWEESHVLSGEVGDFVAIARKERSTGNWFIGAITDENSRTLPISFDFLPEGETWQAIVYRDGMNAHWQNNKTEIIIDTISVTKDVTMDLYLAPGGGVAISCVK
jgi:hypothetical protein